MGTPETSREPCPDRILDDLGGAFGMGAVGGSAFHFIKGLYNAPNGERLTGGITGVRMNAPRVGGGFAVWGGLFSVFDCSMVYARQKEDPWNSIVAGAATGGFLSMRQGARSAARSAVFGGVLLALIEGAGITLNRVLSNPQNFPPMMEDPGAMGPPNMAMAGVGGAGVPAGYQLFKEGAPKSIPFFSLHPSFETLIMSCFRAADSDSPLISSSPPQSDATTSNGRIKRALRRLGCASSESSDAYAPPPAGRSSADWQGKRSRRRRLTQKNHTNSSSTNNNDKERRDRGHHHQHPNLSSSAAAADIVWCGPGFADDSVDCVVRHHAMMMMGRGGRHDAERIHREIMMFQTRMMSGRMNIYDQYRDWRLDVDRMSYEELLELGDKIGYVNTGLREEEISRSLRKMTHSILDASPLYYSTEMEKKCSICQEEYEVDDEMGKLECGHSYHMCCIKQWLLQKNACPVCKTEVTKA